MFSSSRSSRGWFRVTRNQRWFHMKLSKHIFKSDKLIDSTALYCIQICPPPPHPAVYKLVLWIKTGFCSDPDLALEIYSDPDPDPNVFGSRNKTNFRILKSQSVNLFFNAFIGTEVLF